MEENENLKDFDYIDSQISQEMPSAREKTSDSRPKAGSSVDVQRAFKNRVLQFKKLNEGLTSNS